MVYSLRFSGYSINIWEICIPCVPHRSKCLYRRGHWWVDGFGYLLNCFLVENQKESKPYLRVKILCNLHEIAAPKIINNNTSTLVVLLAGYELREYELVIASTCL